MKHLQDDPDDVQADLKKRPSEETANPVTIHRAIPREEGQGS